MQIISRAQQWPDRIAITSDGKDFRFGELLAQSAQIASFLLGEKEDLQQARIAFMVPPGFDYVAIQWGIWRAGGIAVPLSLHAPLPALEYVLEDTGATMLLYDRAFWKKLMPLKEKVALHRLPIEAVEEKELPDMSADRAAMILYTSGTTSRPKGVVSTHANLEAQISCLVKAWEWNMDDQIVCVLPLHHVHGIVNVVSCALWSGARVHFLPKFNPENLFGYMLGSDVTLFMAVPTIYFKLISYWESLPGRGKENISNRLKDFRLLVSGSAALPISVLEKWRKISGHTLLERYGMTEIGMAVSNSYQGERRPGHIGLPLPGVDLRLVDEQDQLVADGESGEIQVKGPSIFREYWQKPEATRESFTTDGWFRTGDIAVFN
ncbi:MAG: AMP-binding protein [Bacteroidota bacterium]